MRNAIYFVSLVAVAALCLGPLVQVHASGGFIVIVHPDNPQASVSRELLADAFLKRRTSWSDGESIDPVDLDPSASTRKHFSEEILKRSVTAVRSYWQQIIFSGRGVPPTELKSEEDTVRFVLRERGGVAYVSPATQVGKAKVLTVR
jgi:ABC-type phosphate transport system substrate-binding protein